MRRYWMEAYGCQMSVAESDAIETLLQGQLWEPAKTPEEAQAVILNTCSVRQTAENRIWGRLGFFAHQKSVQPTIIVLTGCMAERIPDDLRKKAPAIDYIIGTNDKLKIVELLNAHVNEQGVVNQLPRKQKDEELRALHSDSYVFTNLYYKKGDITAYVPIMNGCNNFCTYCIVPYVRGREVSRPVTDIITEIKTLDEMGVREVQLLGQNVNSYNFGEFNFAKLIHEIGKQELKNIQWIRFDSPHPKDFSDDVIEALVAEPKFAHHYHIPLQSGSDRILQLMNRRYTVKHFMSIVQKIKAKLPDATFSTDVMVGFPGENEQEVELTRSVMEEIGLIEAFMYYWNPREGTKATTFPSQIPEPEKVKRLQSIIDFQLKNCAKIKQERAHGVQKVIVTQTSRDDKEMMLGRNEHNEMVAFTSTKKLVPGDVVEVEFKSLNGNTFVGVLAND